MAKNRHKKNPATFYDGIFTHFLIILIFITPADVTVNMSASIYPQKVDIFKLLAANKL